MTLSLTLALTLLLLQAPKGAIEGTVVSSTTNKPIVGAQITAMRTRTPVMAPGSPVITGVLGDVVSSDRGVVGTPDRPSASSDENGRFLLQNLEPGTYIVNAAADGYSRQQIGPSPAGQTGMSTSITVVAGQTAGGAILHLTPAGNVSGRVTGANGEALVGIEVSLIRPTYSFGGRRNLSQMGSTATNDRGEYRLFWIMPGHYYLSVNPSARPMGMMGMMAPPIRNNKYPRTYYPGVSSIDGATEIEITPGGELSGMDFRLSPQVSFTIRGRIVDASSGQVPANATVALVPREQSGGGVSSSSVAYDRNSGTFELRDVLSGSYWVRAQLPMSRPPVPGERPSPPPSAVAAVDVGAADIENVVLTITPPVSIQGHVRVEGQVSLSRPLNVMLAPAASGFMLSQPPAPAQVQADGSFRLDNIGPGEYQVSIPGLSTPGPMPTGSSGQRGLFIKEARIGGTDLLTELLAVAGAVPGDLQIVVSANAGRVTGSVKDDRQQPAPGIQIITVPENRERRDLYKMSATQADGQFTLDGVAPGAYRVFAIAGTDMNSFFDPAVMKKVEASGQAVTVSESSTVTVDLKIVRIP